MPTTEVRVCNMALDRLGHSTAFPDGDGTVAGIADAPNTNKAADLVQRWFAQCRDAMDRDMGFPGSRTYAALGLAEASPSTQVWADIWSNAFIYPPDAISITGFVAPTAGMVTWPWNSSQSIAWQQLDVLWGLGQHGGQVVIFANADAGAVIEYGQATTAALLAQWDTLRVSALAWKVASEIAVPLIGGLPGARFRDFCEQHYRTEVDMARRAALNEQMHAPAPDGSWITSRMGG